MGLFDGVPYDYSAEANRLLFTAGACPLDARGRVVAPGDLEAQTRQTVENLLLALAERGVDARSLVKTTIFVVASERAELVCALRSSRKALVDARARWLASPFLAIRTSSWRSKRSHT